MKRQKAVAFRRTGPKKLTFFHAGDPKHRNGQPTAFQHIHSGSTIHSHFYREPL